MANIKQRRGILRSKGIQHERDGGKRGKALKLFMVWSVTGQPDGSLGIAGGGGKLQKKSTLTIIISSVPHRETSEEVRQSPWFCKYLPRFVRAAHWVVRIDQGELSGKWPNTLIDTVQPRQVKQKFPKGTEILQLQQKHFMFAAA